MSKAKKTLSRILSGQSDNNINFRDLCRMLEHYGFYSHVKGSHHSYRHASVPGRIVIQPRGAMAKDYQVEQVRNIFIEFGLGLNLFQEGDDDES